MAKFAADVVDTGGKFTASVIDTSGNFATDVDETGGKFAAGGFVETGGAPWLANISANFRKIKSGPNRILWDCGETDSWKNQKQKISWHYPFKGCKYRLHYNK